MALRVHVLPESPQAPPLWVCAELRLIGPLLHPSVASRIKASYSTDSRLPSDRLDVVAMQRQGMPGLTLRDAHDLVRTIRSRKAKLVYDIDDDLLARHPVPSVDRNLAPHRAVVRFLLSEADLILCSTTELSLSLSEYSAPKKVWRNAVDERLIERRKVAAAANSSGLKVIGYAGSPTHLRDLLAVTESLRRALTSLGSSAKLEFMGLADSKHLVELWGTMISTRPRPLVAYRDYVRTMQTEQSWDVGIAPLLPCAFNRSKSDIKFLEYAVFGVPGVYSATHAYETVQHGDTGLLSENAVFGETVRDLLDSPTLRETIREKAFAYVMSERTLERRAGDLVSHIEELVASST
jgi:glycosyltransferase involved in cell wall biosynthesis